MKRHSQRAFTLIELLVVIAIIAILAAILFPVFAQAKASAKAAASLSNCKQMALGLHMYAGDFDDVAVRVYPHYLPLPQRYQSTDTWVGLTYPYVKNRQVYWDVMRSSTQTDTWTDSDDGTVYSWAWINNLGLNHDGYSGVYAGTDCNTPYGASWDDTNPIGMRSLTSFETIAERAAVAPTVWGGKSNVGWLRFLGWYAAWPYENPQNYWSFWNEVWDATFVYPGKKITIAYADGHAGKVGKEMFIPESWSQAQRCNASEKVWNFWGRPWIAN